MHGLRCLRGVFARVGSEGGIGMGRGRGRGRGDCRGCGGLG